MIDLYFLFVRDFRGSELTEFTDYFSEEERSASHKFVFRKDRDLYLLTRVFIRKILSSILKVNPRDLVFDRNEFGKPFLKNPASSLQFNLSHTSGLIALAVSSNTETLGIDVENAIKRVKMEIVMPTVFAEEEIQELLSLPVSQQLSRFYDLWTLKESYMKAVGQGFYLPPRSFSFHFVEEGFQFKENPSASQPGEFHFTAYQLEEIYKLAICHKNVNPVIRPFRILPTGHVQEMDISASRVLWTS